VTLEQVVLDTWRTLDRPVRPSTLAQMTASAHGVDPKAARWAVHRLIRKGQIPAKQNPNRSQTVLPPGQSAAREPATAAQDQAGPARGRLLQVLRALSALSDRELAALHELMNAAEAARPTPSELAEEMRAAIRDLRAACDALQAEVRRIRDERLARAMGAAPNHDS